MILGFRGLECLTEVLWGLGACAAKGSWFLYIVSTGLLLWLFALQVT